MLQLLLLLLPIAAIFGWLAGYRYQRHHESETERSGVIPSDYFLGLNYLINEQPDKAVDVFIKLLEVNTDTVETHLALGNLFRRRGEVDRAIRVHQNLIARPQLPRAQREQALFELAHDYLKAGVLDRAERIFLELIELGGDMVAGWSNLIHIYQQQQDWQQAIATAKKLSALSNLDLRNAIAHYYCELAQQAENNGVLEKARGYLGQALKHDAHCARANILLGKLFYHEQDYSSAIRALGQVAEQDATYMSEVMGLLARSYRRLGKDREFSDYLVQRIQLQPRPYYFLAMTDYLVENGALTQAVDYLVEHMQHHFSLWLLERLLALNLQMGVDEQLRERMVLLKEFVDKWLASRPLYRCVHCGFAGKNLYWQCPSCRRWNSVKSIQELEGEVGGGTTG